ncbi:vWA domain-containing protein [Parafrankia discariae]|uniref:vWA domain-containing protein n=1 Tax=Parafrankia discariae TaxID=365528 RepID=UPI000380B43E|nr:VWA domain-containing protein [Parafrankia discariae]
MIQRGRVNRRGRAIRRGAAGLAALLVAGVVATACSGGGGGDPAPAGRPGGSPGALRVLAGSELRDLEPLLDEFHERTGIEITMEYTGTLDGVDRIAARDPAVDAAWFASDRYLRLAPEGRNAVIDRTTTMMSPVVIGVRPELARRFGWVGNPSVTWADIAAKVSTGELTYAMTNPSASNSGFSALVGVAAALAGTSDALTLDDIRPAELTAFFGGQVLTAGSSAWLTDAFATTGAQTGTPPGAQPGARIGAMINYESELLALNTGRLRSAPLTLVYPRDGIITADYPLQLLRGERRTEYERLAGWLRTPEVQRRVTALTHRRPVTPGVRIDPAPWPVRALPAELPFPATRAVADHLLSSYLDEYRRPSHAIFVLDVSPSMEGERLALLRATLKGLAGTDDSLSGRFTRFRGRERVTLITFSGAVHDTLEFTVDDPEPGSAGLAAISAAADGLTLGSGTAIYTAMTSAYSYAETAVRREPDFLTSIVLMTDGENNQGVDAEAFHTSYAGRSEAARAVRTFTVVFGDARVEEMRDIAEWTGGEMFDARSSSLPEAFREIRGYQ